MSALSFFYLTISVASFFAIVSLFHNVEPNKSVIVQSSKKTVWLCNLYIIIFTVSFSLAIPACARLIEIASSSFIYREFAYGLLNGTVVADIILFIINYLLLFCLLLSLLSMAMVRFINFGFPKVFAIAPCLFSVFFIYLSWLLVLVYTQTSLIWIYFICVTVFRIIYWGGLIHMTIKIEKRYGDFFVEK